MKRISEYFNGNFLKLIALISMTVDHIGIQLFPNIELFRVFGRLAFPIFAYMIAEGCAHTKNRKKYFLRIFGTAMICQLFYFVAMNSLYQCIFVTFSLSLLMIFSFDYALKEKSHNARLVAFLALLLTVYLTVFVSQTPLADTDFCIDYGFFGVMLPFAVYFAKNKTAKIILTTICLILLSLDSGTIQWFSLFSVPLLALYNGKRGNLNMKGFFYIYYPLHLAVIYLISLF